jgi:hypothetical protein
MRNPLLDVAETADSFCFLRRAWLSCLQGTQRNPECKERMMAAGRLAEKFEPDLYSVASVHD